jgi:hypothetical protein
VSLAHPELLPDVIELDSGVRRGARHFRRTRVRSDGR